MIRNINSFYKTLVNRSFPTLTFRTGSVNVVFVQHNSAAHTQCKLVNTQLAVTNKVSGKYCWKKLFFCYSTTLYISQTKFSVEYK